MYGMSFTQREYAKGKEKVSSTFAYKKNPHTSHSFLKK